MPTRENRKQERRRSNAAGPHGDRRTKRKRTRADRERESRRDQDDRDPDSRG